MKSRMEKLMKEKQRNSSAIRNRNPGHEATVPLLISYEIYSQPRESCMYFFSSRNRKHPRGNRPRRSAGVGYWKATGADTVNRKGNMVIGTRKAPVYYEGYHKVSKNTDWIMYEYKLAETANQNANNANKPQDNRRWHKYASSSVSNKPPNENRRSSSLTDDDMKLDDCVLCRIYNKGKGTQSPGTLDHDVSPLMQALDNAPLMQGTNFVPGGYINSMPPIQNIANLAASMFNGEPIVNPTGSMFNAEPLMNDDSIFVNLEELAVADHLPPVLEPVHSLPNIVGRDHHHLQQSNP